MNPFKLLFWPVRWLWGKLIGPGPNQPVTVTREREGFCARCGWDAPPGTDAYRLLAFMRHVEDEHRPRP